MPPEGHEDYVSGPSFSSDSASELQEIGQEGDFYDERPTPPQPEPLTINDAQVSDDGATVPQEQVGSNPQKSKVKTSWKPDNFRSEEERKAALLRELRTTSLAKILAQRADELKCAVSIKINMPSFKEQLQASDGLGCVIASFRMVLLAQDKDDPGQEQARRILAEAGLIRDDGGMAVLSEESARALGVESIRTIGWSEKELNLSVQDEQELENGGWPTRLAMAIRKGQIVVGVLPMRFIYECSSDVLHAFVINGVRLLNGKLIFMITDPLGKEYQITDENFINGMDCREPQLLTAPSAEMLKDGEARVPAIIKTLKVTPRQGVKVTPHKTIRISKRKG